MTVENENKLAPLSDLFLMLPKHEGFTLGQTREIGAATENRDLKRSIWLSSIALILLISLTIIQEVLQYLVNVQNAELYQPNVEIIAISLIVIIFFLYDLIRAIRKYRNKQSLERDGVLLPRKVLSAQMTNYWFKAGVHRVSVGYSFTSPTGESLVGRERQLLINFTEAQLPASGQSVAVIYKNDRCYRML